MNRILKTSATAFSLAASLALSNGCSKTEPAAKPQVAEHEHEHGHGPHDGEIIELGSENHHAELVHDDAAGTVSVYVLDGSAEKTAAIDAIEVTINVTHDGAGEQFKLAAAPTADDAAGKSSCFTSTDAKLSGALDAEKANPQLVVTIDGKQYRGELAHDHEHGHDH